MTQLCVLKGKKFWRILNNSIILRLQELGGNKLAWKMVVEPGMLTVW